MTLALLAPHAGRHRAERKPSFFRRLSSRWKLAALRVSPGPRALASSFAADPFWGLHEHARQPVNGLLMGTQPRICPFGTADDPGTAPEGERPDVTMSDLPVARAVPDVVHGEACELDVIA